MNTTVITTTSQNNAGFFTDAMIELESIIMEISN